MTNNEMGNVSEQQYINLKIAELKKSEINEEQ